MYILSFKEGHDPAACLLKDGKIVAAAEEERFNRQKHAPCIFPEEAIKFCLKFAGIEQKDVDHVVYARLKPYQTFFKVFFYYFAHPPITKVQRRYFLSHMKVQVKGTLEELRGKAGYQKLHKLFPGLPKKIYSFNHHRCHAASAYYYSDFEDSLIITADGKGEATSVLIAEGKGNEIKEIERKGVFDSLGLFYSSITKYLGFTPNDGEYKVMGLAPYGRANIDFSDVIKPNKEKGYEINPEYSLYPLSIKNLEKKFGPKREKEGELDNYHKDLATSAQKALEDAGLSLVEYALKKTKSKNICLAGGVALNVKMNKAIWESGMVNNIFVQPAAGDDGLVFGAVAVLYQQLTGKRVGPLKNLYFGPEYDLNIIKESFEKHKLKYKESSDVVGDTADLIASGKVVGWFSGRMEFGPRALGSRSILAHPGIEGMRDQVNMKIKFREGFRPFCPSVLKERVAEYFKNYTDSSYMVMSFETLNSEISQKISAVVHVDNTVRPQAVDKEINPLYYSLIEAFEKRTGLPMVLNTSMNVRGEPIVCSPDDLVNFFVKTNVDAIVAGNYIAVKEDQDQEILNPIKELKTEY